MERVLLTGVTGYIGQHCAAALLMQGYDVVGTIRSHAKADATRAAIAKVAPVDRLSFVEADLLSDTGWDAGLQVRPARRLSLRARRTEERERVDCPRRLGDEARCRRRPARRG